MTTCSATITISSNSNPGSTLYVGDSSQFVLTYQMDTTDAATPLHVELYTSFDNSAIPAQLAISSIDIGSNYNIPTPYPVMISNLGYSQVTK